VEQIKALTKIKSFSVIPNILLVKSLNKLSCLYLLSGLYGFDTGCSLPDGFLQ